MTECKVDRTTIFETLANEHRRRLLFALLEHNPQHEIQIPDGLSVEDKEREQIQTVMYHMHLPKLEEHGFIEWDRDAHRVKMGPTFESVQPFLELLDENANALPDN